MRAKVLIEELPADADVGYCLVIQSCWTEDDKYKLALRIAGKLDATNLAEGLKALASAIEEQANRLPIDRAVFLTRRIEDES